MSDFARLLSRRRQEAHLTQAELARRVGVKQQTVARWERGTSTPSRDMLTRVASAFGEPDDEWVRIAGRNDASDRLRLLAPVRPRVGYLLLGELTPKDFERFTFNLLAARHPSARVTRVGDQGHAQQGADILVRTPDGLRLFQCKRVQRFGPSQMKAVAEAAEGAIAGKRVLVLSRVASPAARSTAESLGWDIWDHDDIVRMLQQEISPQSAGTVLDNFFPGWREDFLGIRGRGPWARPDAFFAGQREESPFSHAHELIGREAQITTVLEWAQSERPFFLLSGAAGVGKSRFLMEAARRIDAVVGRPAVYFVQKTASVDLEDFRRLAEDRAIIAVDDAHDRDDLELIIRGALSRPDPQRRPLVLFATRDYGEPRLLRGLAEHAHELDPPMEHLAPLACADARRLASRVLGAPENSPLTIRLARVARDCTLFLVAAGHLLKEKHVDPAFLDEDEGFRVAVLERMYEDYVRGADQVTGDISVADVLRFLAAVHPFDLDDDDALKAATRVLGCGRDVLTSALGQIVKTGVVVKRGSRLRLQPDLLADHILVIACFDRTLGRATGYVDRIWKVSSPALRRNLIVNVARIDWRLSETMSSDSMLTEAWRVLDREFKASGIPQRRELLDLLKKVAFYQPERTLSLVEWALDNELPSEHTPLIEYTYEDVIVRVAPVLEACARRREWLYRACELLWRLAQSDQRPTNPHPDHPARILCDLAGYSRYKPFDYTQQVTSQAIDWLQRDGEKLVFDILDHALRKEFEDHISDDHAVRFYVSSALELGRERVLALRDQVLDAVVEQFLGNDTSLAVRAAESLKLALTAPVGLFGREPDTDEMTVWDQESVRLLKRVRAKLDAARLAPPVAVALRKAVEPATHCELESIRSAAKEVMSTLSDDLDHKVVEMLIDGPWRWHRRHRRYCESSPSEAQQRLKDLARRFLEDNAEPLTAVQRFEQHLAEIGVSSVASGAANFAAALVAERLCVGVEIVRRVIADDDSPLVQATGVTLSAIRAADAERALELARALLDADLPKAKMSVAQAYGGGLASAPAVSSAELAIIRDLAADDNVEMAYQISFGLRFVAERDPMLALMIIREMRIGRSEQLAGEVLELFADSGPLDIDRLGEEDLEEILSELVGCDRIDDYGIEEFLASLSRSDLQSVVRLLRRRVEYAESLGKSVDYFPVPFRWPDDRRLESRGTPDRRRVLQELLEWASKDEPGWMRRSEAPRIFTAVADEFDGDVLGVLAVGLKAPAAVAINVANLLSAVPRDFAWSRDQWIVRVLEDAARRDTELYRAIGRALHSALMSGSRTGTPGEPFAEDVEQRDKARKIADELPVGSPGERFYRSLQRAAEHAIERERNEDWA